MYDARVLTLRFRAYGVALKVGGGGGWFLSCGSLFNLGLGEYI